MTSSTPIKRVKLEALHLSKGQGAFLAELGNGLPSLYQTPQGPKHKRERLSRWPVQPVEDMDREPVEALCDAIRYHNVGASVRYWGYGRAG
jgi:hypothetical protein